MEFMTSNLTRILPSAHVENEPVFVAPNGVELPMAPVVIFDSRLISSQKSEGVPRPFSRTYLLPQVPRIARMLTSQDSVDLSLPQQVSTQVVFSEVVSDVVTTPAGFVVSQRAFAAALLDVFPESKQFINFFRTNIDATRAQVLAGGLQENAVDFYRICVRSLLSSQEVDLIIGKLRETRPQKRELRFLKYSGLDIRHTEKSVATSTLLKIQEWISKFDSPTITPARMAEELHQSRVEFFTDADKLRLIVFLNDFLESNPGLVRMSQGKNVKTAIAFLIADIQARTDTYKKVVGGDIRKLNSRTKYLLIERQKVLEKILGQLSFTADGFGLNHKDQGGLDVATILQENQVTTEERDMLVEEWQNRVQRGLFHSGFFGNIIAKRRSALANYTPTQV